MNDYKLTDPQLIVQQPTPIYRTKTFWAGIAAVISGLGAYFTGEASVAEAAQVVFTGLIGIFLRAGINRVK